MPRTFSFPLPRSIQYNLLLLLRRFSSSITRLATRQQATLCRLAVPDVDCGFTHGLPPVLYRLHLFTLDADAACPFSRYKRSLLSPLRFYNGFYCMRNTLYHSTLLASSLPTYHFVASPRRQDTALPTPLPQYTTASLLRGFPYTAATFASSFILFWFGCRHRRLPFRL